MAANTINLAALELLKKRMSGARSTSHPPPVTPPQTPPISQVPSQLLPPPMIPTPRGSVFNNPSQSQPEQEPQYNRIEAPAQNRGYTMTAEEVSRLTLKMRPEFEPIGILSSGITSTDVWTDEMLLKGDYWQLNIVGEQQLQGYCKRVIEALQDGVSTRDVGYIILLAWNVRSTTDRGRSIFHHVKSSGQPISIDSLSNKKDFKGGSVTYEPDQLSEEEIQAVCFICASLLRLFTKEVSSYDLAYKRHLKDSYYKFYNDLYPLSEWNLNVDALKGVKAVLTTIPACKGSLGRFLYCYSILNTSDRGLCTLLFEQHLGLTGMHAVGLFVRVCAGLQMPAEKIMSALWHAQTKTALLCIYKIITKYEQFKGVDKTPIQKKTWKYARVFDQSVFADVQTKNCIALVCALAHLCEKLGQGGDRNILDIACIRNLPASSQEMYERWATKIYNYFTSSNIASTR